MLPAWRTPNLLLLPPGAVQMKPWWVRQSEQGITMRGNWPRRHPARRRGGSRGPAYDFGMGAAWAAVNPDHVNIELGPNDFQLDEAGEPIGPQLTGGHEIDLSGVAVDEIERWQNHW